MIYYIATLPADIDSLERDPIFNTIKNFEIGEFDYQVLLPQFVPFLRYLGAEYGMYDGDHVVHVFDQIQDIHQLQGFPMTMGDLILPHDAEQVYINGQVMLYQGKKRIGQVSFNRFGFVKQMTTIHDDYTQVDCYSDRGFMVLSQFKNADDQIFKTIFYNDVGEKVLIADLTGIHVEPDKQALFDHRDYRNMAALYTEFLNQALQQFDETRDYLIFDIENDWLLDFARQFKAPERIIFEHIKPESLSSETLAQHADVLDGHTIVTDTPTKAGQLMQLESQSQVQQSIAVIPTFVTELNLGESNALAESYVYWRIGLVDDEFKALFWRMLHYRTDFEDLRLIVDCQAPNDQYVLQAMVEKFVNEELHIDTHSEIFIMIQKYYEAVKQQKLMEPQQKAFEAAQKSVPGFQKIDDAYQFMDHMGYRYQSTTQELDDDFHFTRVFVDDRRPSDLFIQSRVVGAGIPIISREPSIYFKDGENGALIEKQDELFEQLSALLVGNGKWNRTLVASIDEINSNGTDQLIESWRDILHAEKK